MSDEERPHRILEVIQNIPFRKIISAIGQAPRFPVITIIIFIICGLFGKLIAPHDPTGTSFRLALTPPCWMTGGLWTYPLGTDHLGRDILSRMIVGAGASLEVGIMVVVFSGLVGASVSHIRGLSRG